MLARAEKVLTEEPDNGGHMFRSRAYDRFMAGMDTAQIAKFYHVHERTALRWISHERSRRHGLPVPYASQSEA